MGQAPRGTFLGAVSLGFCPDLETKRPWCTGAGLTSRKSADGKSIAFSASKTLTEPWYVLQGREDQVCRFDLTSAFMTTVPEGHLVNLPKVGHGLSVQRNGMPQFKSAFNQIARSGVRSPQVSRGDSPASAVLKDRASIADVSQLPLVEVPAIGGGASDTLAVMITGDGGWAGLDRAVSAGLASNGVPVVGFDSLSYFWNRRTPSETAEAIGATLSHYMAAWNKRRVILIGYSFGADVMPFVVSRLAEDLKQKLRLVAIVSPSQDAEFEFHVADWAGLSLGEASKAQVNVRW
jgi:Bacterial virulence protein (VirJ)